MAPSTRCSHSMICSTECWTTECSGCSAFSSTTTTSASWSWSSPKFLVFLLMTCPAAPCLRMTGQASTTTSVIDSNLARHDDGRGSCCPKTQGESCMKRTLLMFVAAAGMAGSAVAQVPVVPGTPAQVSRALDEAPGTWADAAVELVVSRGIYIGNPDGSFQWRDDISRVEMAMIIARLIQTYNLDAFNPDEIAMLRQAVSGMQDELAGLRALVQEHD